MRYLAILLAVLLVGCEAGTSASPEQFTPIIASEIGLVASQAVNVIPSPQPELGVCSNCRGTGKVGDGRVMVACAVCDGTGRIVSAAESDKIKAKLAAWEEYHRELKAYEARQASKKTQSTGHYETRCNGNSCQRVWVEGPSEQKGPVKQSPAARTEPQSFQPVRRGLFGGRFR